MASIIKVDQIQESTTGAGTSFPHIIYADDDTTANTPVLSFTGDTNTGIGRSAADTLDFITNGNSRFRIEPTGQIKAVYESQVGTDYNTQLDNGYLCRAWVNFNGTGTVAIRASGNVSSITDNGTGTYTVNFTTPMPDGQFACFGMAQLSISTGRENLFVSPRRENNLPTNSYRIGVVASDTTISTDAQFIMFGLFR